ncbi:unnamed protein product [Rhizoctonia solani]|uniref:Uncharacterized protein n=1 Tax=Rhizoctonia solani TaxID=456999 RepID=A0A8H2X2I1_9AGAM|nr:unnamed protein product [Rhizoctonia solani]
MDTTSRIHTGAAHKSTGVGALPRDNEEGVPRPSARRTSLPSEEYEGAKPGEKSGGVGSLPGHLSESNVALLPDERENLAKEGVEPSALTATHMHPTSEHPDKKDLKPAVSQPTTGEQPSAPKRKTSLKDKFSGGMKAAMDKLKRDEDTFAERHTQRGH